MKHNIYLLNSHSNCDLEKKKEQTKSTLEYALIAQTSP